MHDRKVTIVAHWETDQMEPGLEMRMWRQLRGAFEIDEFIMTPVIQGMDGARVRQAPSMEEALDMLPDDCHRVFLEPTGYNTMYDIPNGHIAIILGNTGNHNMEHAHVNETYAIKSPGNAVLYGINAAAIALAHEYGQ